MFGQVLFFWCNIRRSVCSGTCFRCDIRRFFLPILCFGALLGSCLSKYLVMMRYLEVSCPGTCFWLDIRRLFVQVLGFGATL